jgi:hypothetical protein
MKKGKRIVKVSEIATKHEASATSSITSNKYQLVVLDSVFIGETTSG